MMPPRAVAVAIGSSFQEGANLNRPVFENIRLFHTTRGSREYSADLLMRISNLKLQLSNISIINLQSPNSNT